MTIYIGLPYSMVVFNHTIMNGRVKSVAETYITAVYCLFAPATIQETEAERKRRIAEHATKSARDHKLMIEAEKKRLEQQAAQEQSAYNAIIYTRQTDAQSYGHPKLMDILQHNGYCTAIEAPICVFSFFDADVIVGIFTAPCRPYTLAPTCVSGTSVMIIVGGCPESYKDRGVGGCADYCYTDVVDRGLCETISDFRDKCVIALDSIPCGQTVVEENHWIFGAIDTTEERRRRRQVTNHYNKKFDTILRCSVLMGKSWKEIEHHMYHSIGR